MFGIVPQLPLSAEVPEELELALAVGELAVLAELDELLDELDEHAVPATSSAAPPRPNASLVMPRLIRSPYMAYSGGALKSPGSTSLKLSFATSSFIGFAVPHWS